MGATWFIIGVSIGIAIGFLVKPSKPCEIPDNEDPTGSIKQDIFDKLTSLKEDISKTV